MLKNISKNVMNNKLFIFIFLIGGNNNEKRIKKKNEHKNFREESL